MTTQRAKSKYDLATILSQLAETADVVETVAGDMLAAIRERDAKNVDSFNDMIDDAYTRNGWSRKVGRPADGAIDKPAPDAVKLYVSIVRSGYKLGLSVLTYETMSALRKDIREKRSRIAVPVEKAPELVGVQIAPAQHLTGALWHDVITVWDHLPTDEQQALETQIRRLIAKFSKATPLTVVKAA